MRVPIRLSADFSTETLQTRREWHEIFKVMKRKNLKPSYSIQQGYHFFKFIFLLFMLLQFLIFLPFPTSSPSPILSPPQTHPHIVVHVHRLCTNILWLIPSPSFTSHLFSFLEVVSLSYVSKHLLLFCSLVYCVH